MRLKWPHIQYHAKYVCFCTLHNCHCLNNTIRTYTHTHTPGSLQKLEENCSSESNCEVKDKFAMGEKPFSRFHSWISPRRKRIRLEHAGTDSRRWAGQRGGFWLPASSVAKGNRKRAFKLHPRNPKLPGKKKKKPTWEGLARERKGVFFVVVFYFFDFFFCWNDDVSVG